MDPRIIDTYDGAQLGCFYTKQYRASNFFPSTFELEGHEFKCVEHFYQWKKALAAGAEAVADDVLLLRENPAEMKAATKDLSMPPSWESEKKQVMLQALTAKFSQNAELAKKLLDTKGIFLVETNPNDSFWGIGLGLRDPKLKSLKNWKNSNWLGFLLVYVRDKILCK